MAHTHGYLYKLPINTSREIRSDLTQTNIMQPFLSLLLAVPVVLSAATIDRRQTAGTVSGSWIARVEDGSLLVPVLTAVRTLGITTKDEYNIGNFRGFAFDGDDSLVDLIASVAQVATIEPDTKVYASAPVTQRALGQQTPAE